MNLGNTLNLEWRNNHHQCRGDRALKILKKGTKKGTHRGSLDYAVRSKLILFCILLSCFLLFPPFPPFPPFSNFPLALGYIFSCLLPLSCGCRGQVEDPLLSAFFPLNKIPLFNINGALAIIQVFARSWFYASREDSEADLSLSDDFLAGTAKAKLILLDIECICELLLDHLLIGVLLDTLELEVDVDHVLEESVL